MSDDELSGATGRFHAQYFVDDLVDPELSSDAGVSWPVIVWLVESPDEQPGNGFFVDLGQFASVEFKYRPVTRPVRAKPQRAPQRRRNTSSPNWPLTLALAPSIREWSVDRLHRTVAEELSKLRWFYRFVDERLKLMPGFGPGLPAEIDPDILQRLDVGVGFEFADWLRHQKMGDARRSGLYATAKSRIEAATGMMQWRGNPFAADPRALTGAALPTLEIGQFRALIALSKEVVRRWRLDRQALLRSRRASEHSALAAEVAKVQSALAESSATGMEPALLNTVIYPSADLVCAAFLLSLCRLASNEQPLLDARPVWSMPNPLNADRRSIVLWKNRSGGKGGRSRLRRKGPKRIQLPSSRKPFFHAYQQMRMVQRLTAPLRARLRRVILHGADAQTLASAEKLAASFWLYVGDDGQFRALAGNSMHRSMNEFIVRHAATYPALIGPDGEVVRYSAKAIRDAYLEFVTKKAGSDLGIGQTELSHGENSTAIRTYLRKRWARRHVKDGFSLWQAGVFDQMRDSDVDLSPAVLRDELSVATKPVRDLSKRVSVPPRRRASKVGHGLYCRDAANPPKEVRVLMPGETCCPAEVCYDCPWARCYDESLPEIALDILALRRDRDDGPLDLWSGSLSATRLQKLEDLFARWPEQKRVKAMQTALTLELPPQFLGARR